MLLKAAVIVCALVSTPIIATTLQEPQGGQRPGAVAQDGTPRDAGDLAPLAPTSRRAANPAGSTQPTVDHREQAQRIAALRAEIARLRTELEQSRGAATQASAQGHAAQQRARSSRPNSRRPSS